MLKRILVGLIVAIVMTGAGVAGPDAKLTSTFNEAGAEVVYYPAGDCEPEMAVECQVAGIRCVNGSELYLDVWGLTPADVRRWFRDGNPVARIEGLGKTPAALMLDELGFNVVNGDWTASFVSGWPGPNWLANVNAATKIMVHASGRTISLPLAAGDRDNLKRLADACHLP